MQYLVIHVARLTPAKVAGFEHPTRNAWRFFPALLGERCPHLQRILMQGGSRDSSGKNPQFS